MKKLIALPLLALSIGAILVAAVQLRGSGEPPVATSDSAPAMSLDGISADELRANGIELLPASKSVQPDTLNAVSQDATARFGSATKETVVARVVSSELLLDSVFIVASMDVSGETTEVSGVPGSKYEGTEASMMYSLVLFNPDDGSFVQAISAARLPEEFQTPE
jgi:hypothetical protein